MFILEDFHDVVFKEKFSTVSHRYDIKLMYQQKYFFVSKIKIIHMSLQQNVCS